MRYCKSCHLKYEVPLEHCLFCNNPLSPIESETPANVSNYPAYQKIHHKRRFFLKLMTFLILVADFLCLIINITTTDGRPEWAVYVTISTIYTLLLLCILTKRSHFVLKLIQMVLLTDLLLLSIGINAGNYRWCTSCVIPFSLISLNLYSVCNLFGKKQRIHDNSIYTIILSILGLLLGFLLHTDFLTTPWFVLTCMIYSGITLFSLLLFSPKTILDELYRRLHF